MARWPSAVLQFEDFSMKHALTLLQRYRNHHTVFNDDIQASACALHHHPHAHTALPSKPMMAVHFVLLHSCPSACTQGTATTALAGLYGALRVLGQSASELTQQRVLCVGAGSAGMGVVSMIAAGT